MKRTISTIALLLAIAAQGQTFTNWTDTNKDGCADGWRCKSGQPALIATQGFRTNAQQAADADYFRIETTPIRQQAGRHQIYLRYIASAPATVTVWIDESTTLDVMELAPTLTATSVSCEYWVPSQRLVMFTGCGWLQIDDVMIYPLQVDEPGKVDSVKRVKVSEWKEFLQLNKVRP